MQNKKAISPLLIIATVLIIGFTVILISFIVNFGGIWIETSCSVDPYDCVCEEWEFNKFKPCVCRDNPNRGSYVDSEEKLFCERVDCSMNYECTKARPKTEIDWNKPHKVCVYPPQDRFLATHIQEERCLESGGKMVWETTEWAELYGYEEEKICVKKCIKGWNLDKKDYPPTVPCNIKCKNENNEKDIFCYEKKCRGYWSQLYKDSIPRFHCVEIIEENEITDDYSVHTNCRPYDCDFQTTVDCYVKDGVTIKTMRGDTMTEDEYEALEEEEDAFCAGFMRGHDSAYNKDQEEE